MRRAVGVFFGLANQVLFLATVWYLFWFLRESATPREGARLGWDVLLALQFCVIHSWLLHPAARRRIERFIAPAFYGTFFSAATCLSLLVTIGGWQTSSHVALRAEGAAAGLIVVAFYLSWLALFASLRLTGFGYQTGWTTFLAWWRGERPARRVFEPQGAYRWMRHPVYFSFLGLLWFTPVVSVDRFALIVIWTAYIGVGSYLKDQRLVYYLGDTYRAYQAQVPGYPWIAFGPWGRIPFAPAPPGAAQVLD